MIRKHVQPYMDWLKRVVTEPRDELDRWQTFVRFAYDLCVHGWRALSRDNAPQMAAALTFRTLFALLPVIVVSAVLVNAWQGPAQFKSLAAWMVDVAGLDAVRVQTPESVVDVEDPKSLALGEWLEGLIDQIAQLNLAAIGWIGVAVMVYSAISLMVTIENSFNGIYGAPQGRSWPRRIQVYWTVLALGPLVIGIATYLDSEFNQVITSLPNLKWLLTPLKIAAGFSVTWLLMLAVYTQIPNTKVNIRAALAGSFVVAVLLMAGRQLLGAYFQGVALGNIYGTIGAVPIFMFWMYLMWLVILFGLEVSATIQRLQGRQLEELEEEERAHSGLVDPASVLNVMEIITERFQSGQPTTTRDIADEVLIPEAMISQLVDRLAREGLLHRLDAPEGAVSLARPPEQIHGDRLMEIAFSLADGAGTGRQSPLLKRLREAQINLARQATLASLLMDRGRRGGGDHQVAPG